MKYEPEEYRKLFRALFDENILLQKEGFKHPENKKHKGGIYLFEDHSGIRYPDFYLSEIRVANKSFGLCKQAHKMFHLPIIMFH